MCALTPLTELGLIATVSATGNLKIKGLAALPKDEAARIVEFAKQHKSEILAALSQADGPGQCESCPAAGYWDYAQYADAGLLCFHYAYYRGKPGRPKPCKEARKACPRLDE